MTEPRIRNGKTATERIIETLVADVRQGRLGHGDKIPSRSLLAKRFGVSSLTVTAAFRRLTASGVLMHVPGRGLFVTQASDARLSAPISLGLIGWFVSQPGCEKEPGTYWHTILHDLIRAAARADISLTLIPNTGCEPLAVDMILKQRPTVLVSHGILLSERTLMEFRRRQVPLILGNRYAEHLGVSYVDYDTAGACATLVRHCHGRGHDRIAFLLTRLLIPDVEHRAFDAVCKASLACRHFRDYARDWRSLDVDRQHLTVERRRAFARQETLNLLREASPPTAFCCLDDEMERGVREAIEACGLAAGRDVGVATFRTSDPGTTSAVLAPHAELATALVAAAQVLAGDPHAIRQVDVAMKFVDHGTIPIRAKKGAVG